MKRARALHDYGPSISKDCIVGHCSINNCLYPDCSPEWHSHRQHRNRMMLGVILFVAAAGVFCLYAVALALS